MFLNDHYVYWTERCFETSNLPGLFPEDLQDWVEEPALAQLITHAVEASQEPSPANKVLLGLIVYSYLTGKYLSNEIERTFMRTSSALQNVNEPVAAAVRRYRRYRRPTLEACLVEALRLLSGMNPLPGLDREQLQSEAVRRVDRAVRMDCWDMDV